MITATWLNSIWNSADSLSSVVTKANWGIAATLLLGCFFTALAIVAGNRKDELLKSSELVKEQRIAEGYKMAAEANQRAAEANVIAETARLEQEKLRKQNLELESQVETERTERLKLQQRTLPRHLTPEQAKKLTDLLTASKRHGEIAVYVYIGTDDGTPFSLELISVINKAPGWVARHKGQNTAGGQVTGVALLVKDIQTTPLYVVDLHNALKAIGVDAPIGNISAVLGENPGPPIPILFIAPRP